MGKLLSFLNSAADALTAKHRTSALILAAGSGERFSEEGTVKKQFCPVGGVPAVLRSALAFDRCDDVTEIIVAAGEDDIEECRSILDGKLKKKLTVVPGGATRRESAAAALEAVDPESKYIAVHDAARCLVTEDIIKKVILEAVRHGAAAAAEKATDTVKRSDPSGMIAETLDRDSVWMVKTPQIFLANMYRAGMYTAIKDDADVTDDCMLVERLGFKVKLVECGRENIKITYPADAVIVEAILRERENAAARQREKSEKETGRK